MQKVWTVQEFEGIRSHTYSIAIKETEREHRQAKKQKWNTIKTHLTTFHSTDKTQLRARWAALQGVKDACWEYLGGMSVAPQGAGNRARNAETLYHQATVRPVQEQAKAAQYGEKVQPNASLPAQVPDGRQSAGRALGQGPPQHAAVRFERALVGGPVVVHGHSLVSKNLIALEGNDDMDAYALRSLVKKLAREGKLAQGEELASMVIPYFNEADRAQHVLEFTTDYVHFQGQKFSTVGVQFVSGDHQAMYAVSQDGAFYARKQVLAGGFNHSCFMAGDSVIAAGMIAAIDGRLMHINNASGHYGGGLEELRDAGEIINSTGYRYQMDFCVLYVDFTNRYNLGPGKEYRIPFRTFEANPMPNNPQDYEVKMGRYIKSIVDHAKDMCLQYVNPNAARMRGAAIPRVLQT